MAASAGLLPLLLASGSGPAVPAGSKWPSSIPLMLPVLPLPSACDSGLASTDTACSSCAGAGLPPPAAAPPLRAPPAAASPLATRGPLGIAASVHSLDCWRSGAAGGGSSSTGGACGAATGLAGARVAAAAPPPLVPPPQKRKARLRSRQLGLLSAALAPAAAQADTLLPLLHPSPAAGVAPASECRSSRRSSTLTASARLKNSGT